MSVSEHARRVADIGELDDDGQRLRVTWRKTHNFVASFAKILMETKAKFESSDYGTDKYGCLWTFDSWLGFKAGLVESQVYRMLNVFEKALSDNDREIIAAEQLRMSEERRAEKNRIAEERRATRTQRAEEKEQHRQAVQARKQASQLAKQLKADEAARTKKNDSRSGTDSRVQIITDYAIEAVKEAVKNNQLSKTRAAEIGRKGNPPELQAELLAKELENPNRLTRPRKTAPKLDGDLKRLTRECHLTVGPVRVALELDKTEARRERVRAYGAALLPIRDLLQQSVKFNAHLRANDLEVRDTRWRSDAMWLAANWDGLQHSLSDCPYINPGDIRKWLRQRDESFRDFPKAESAEIIRIH